MGDPRNHGPTSSHFLYVFFQYHWANSSRWQRMPRPRWALRLEAFAWRNLMDLGMFLHRLHSPRPLSPSFRRSIPVTVSPRKGTINLLFYTPGDYPQRHSDNGASKYPVLVNFHGGGYTIGKASDDARWATAVVELWGPWSSALSIAWHRSTPS